MTVELFKKQTQEQLRSHRSTWLNNKTRNILNCCETIWNNECFLPLEGFPGGRVGAKVSDPGEPCPWQRGGWTGFPLPHSKLDHRRHWYPSANAASAWLRPDGLSTARTEPCVVPRSAERQRSAAAFHATPLLTRSLRTLWKPSVVMLEEASTQNTVLHLFWPFVAAW